MIWSRTTLIHWIRWGCLITAIGPGTLAAAVNFHRSGEEYRVNTEAYTATVGADGCLTSLNIQGEPFLTAATNFPRGLYLDEGGLLPLTNLTQQAPASLLAQHGRVSVRYTFAEHGLELAVTNRHAKKILAVLVFDRGIKLVAEEGGRMQRTPANQTVATTTWFREKASLRLEGGTRIWGPWKDGLQVWEASVEAGKFVSLRLTVNPADEAQWQRARQTLSRPPPPPPQDPAGPMWNLAALAKPPRTFPAADFATNELQALFFEGLPFDDAPTRVFAWIGIPKVAPGQKVPGMVLIHGGGGTAFAEWVRLWNERGYAAIAMDTCGCVPGGKSKQRPRHEAGGPPGWGGWSQIDWPREDQWTYHAVADVILAHSLLRSLPGVDAERIGVTGISWGGYLTCIVAGVDSRFRFAVPVYGCGFTTEHTFADRVSALGPEGAARWMRWWDPSVYLPAAAMPILWVTGSNDFAYTMNALQKSYRLPRGARTLAIRLRMPHGHGGAGENPKEIHVFAESQLNGGQPLARLIGQGCQGREAWASFQAAVPLVKAELNFTRQFGKWPERQWESVPATLDAAGKASATLPEGATVYYFNAFDTRGCVVSSEHEER